MKYLYLDDEQIQLTQDIVELLESERDDLEIIWSQPKSFGEEIKRLKSEVYDGLMLDLRLDQKSDAEYRAFSLAQEIRTRATEGTMKDIPIVVCSTDRKLKASYNKDTSGQDLFDRKYLKTKDLGDDSKTVANELVSLAKGYALLSSIKSDLKGKGVQLDKFLLLNDSQLKFIDKRVFEFFNKYKTRLPIHEYASFVFDKLIIPPGILLDKGNVLARLGVDENSPELEELLSKINNYKYKGAFGDHWERWWWPLIENWFSSKSNFKLSFMTAEERVDELKRIVKLEELKSAKALASNYSSKFWALCEFYKKPLDPYTDGVVLEEDNLSQPWQENRYISMKAALDVGSKAAGLIPHPSEKEKVKAFSKILKNE
ncbi:hypothetical protein [Flagellimonas meridianipacifica]|uniref:Uncharacterized protein n=1 Tax=Flagellimonas meridianipacifica TaxID=1080225 RepID=A0A2T0MII2_9FLAO|nr:hypothetical protein [Allomuricauda pacifica]PRX57369.1 hypothetical protein CLV81_1373 [Allomuricauda pacifica]